MVPLEAAAAGRPVIATEGGGYSEVLNESCARFVPRIPTKSRRASLRCWAILRSPAGWELRDARLRQTTAGSVPRASCSSCSAKPFRVAVTRPRDPLLGAHYYPWYRAGEQLQHWNENREFAAVTDLPLGASIPRGSRINPAASPDGCRSATRLSRGQLAGYLQRD